jgi:putative hydrolase of the HAD superfamily
MARPVKGIIFDYGSTLMQFDVDAHAIDPLANQSLLRQLVEEGVPVLPDRFLSAWSNALAENDSRRTREWKEIPTETILARVLTETGLADVPRGLHQRAMQRFYMEYEAHWQLYPEAKSVLEWIRDRHMKIGMITNAGDAANIHRLMATHQIAEYFDPLVVSSLEGVRKPDPSLFQKVLRAWQLDASAVVMVGDQLGMDVLGAQKAGIRSIWMRTETEMRANRADRGTIIADAEADSIGQIPEILSAWQLQAEETQ